MSANSDSRLILDLAEEHGLQIVKAKHGCCLCNKPIAMTSAKSQGTTFYHQGGLHLAIHVACGTLADVLPVKPP